MHMRLHINLDDETARQIDQVAGPRKRSSYIREAIEAKLEIDRRVAARRRLVGAYPDFAPRMTAEWISENRKREGKARQKQLDEWWGAGLVLDTPVLIDLLRGEIADESVLSAFWRKRYRPKGSHSS